MESQSLECLTHRNTTTKSSELSSILTFDEPNDAPIVESIGPFYQSVEIPHDGDPETALATVEVSVEVTDSHNDELEYAWTIISALDGSIIENDQISSEFVFDLAQGLYSINATITDSYGLMVDSDAVPAYVTEELNQSPVANAGDDIVIEIEHDGIPGGEAVAHFDGRDSYDPDEIDYITGSWSDSDVEFANGLEAEKVLSVGSHTITLTVTDPYGSIGTDDVMIEVVEPNAAPVLECDLPDLEIVIPHDGDPSLCTSVDLTCPESIDPDGDDTECMWMIEGSEYSGDISVCLSNGSSDVDVFIRDIYGLDSGTCGFAINIEEENNAPYVGDCPESFEFVLEHDGTPNAGEYCFDLDGSCVTDNDGDEFGCDWQTGERDSGGGCVVPICLPEGEYVYSLLVTDSYGAESILNQSVIVLAEPNEAPVAVAESITVVANHSGDPDEDTAVVTVDGRDSYDDDGDSFEFSWVSTTNDCGSECSGSDSTLVVELSPGSYTVLLTVTDNYNSSSSVPVDIVVLPADNIAPAISDIDETFEPVHDGDPETDIAVISIDSGAADEDEDSITCEWEVGGEEDLRWLLK